jgi:hypothetical protein
MMYRKIISVCSESLQQHINALVGPKVEFLKVEPGSTFPLIFFTAARTCYSSEQKIFTRPDDGAALETFFVICIIRIFTTKI